MTKKTKTISFRPRRELLKKIDSVCEKLDCNRSDYINTVLESAISEDIEEENNSRSDRNTTPKEITVRDIPDKEPNPKDPSTWKNNKKSPKQIEVIWI